MTNNLRELAEKATPGPWKFIQKLADHVDAKDGDVCMLTDNLFTGFTRPLLDRRNNGAYIAAASPDVIIAMCDEVDRLRSVIQLIYDNSIKFDWPYDIWDAVKGELK